MVVNGHKSTITGLTIFIITFTDLSTQTRIVNPHPFKYLHNHEHICAEDTDLLIWVHTAPQHHRHRMILRETWANPANYHKHKAALVFFLGNGTSDEVNALISHESEQYRDLVQSSYTDSYRNLTYKAIQGCKWTSTYCKSAKIILKVDDDMMVDIHLLFTHLYHLQKNGLVLNNTILCDVWKNRWPAREGKWKVNKTEFAGKSYPTYCPGLALIMTADLAPKLFNASLYEPYFWIDDVFFTGILAKAVNATFREFGATFHFGGGEYVKLQTQFSDPYKYIFYHIHNHNMRLRMWEQLESREAHRQLNLQPSYV